MKNDLVRTTEQQREGWDEAATAPKLRREQRSEVLVQQVELAGLAEAGTLNRAGFPGGPIFLEIGVIMANKASPKYAHEVRERAVRMVFEHAREHASPWAVIGSIAAKIGCNPETLRGWDRQAGRDQGKRPGPTTDERERITALEPEVRERRQANEILRKAYFARAELDRPFKE